MTAPPPSALSRDALLAGLGRLSQGRGLTYDERTRLGDPPDLTFVESRIEVLESQRRWQPALLGALAIVGLALLLFAGGATVNPATWARAMPSLPLLLLCLPAFATPYLKRRALSQKLSIYRALRAMAAPSPTA